MKIIKLEIKQFRGLKDISLEFNDNVNILCGLNGIGKTTVIDSLMWLLCDETYVYGKQNEDNKNKHNTKDIIEVVGTFVLDNGNKKELKRTYYENWKTLEDGELDFKGIENKFEINGAKYKLNEYLDAIRGMLGLKNDVKTKNFNILRCLLDTNYLDNIDYKIARKFVEEILELPEDEFIVEQNINFNLIKNDLDSQNYDIEKTNNYFKNKINKINEENLKLNNENETYNKLIDNELISKREELYKKGKAILESNVEDSEKLVEIKVLIDNNDKLIEEETKTLKNEINCIETKQLELQKQGEMLLNNINNIETIIESKNSIIDNFNSNINSISEKLSSLKNDLKELKELNFKKIECPNCHTVLNQEEEKLFEENKKNDIKLYEKQIAELKDQKTNIKLNIEKINQEIEKFNNDREDFNSKFSNLKESYNQNANNIESIKSKLNDNEKIKQLSLENEQLLSKYNLLKDELENKKTSDLVEISNKLHDIKNMNDYLSVIDKNKSLIHDNNKNKAILETKKDLLEEFKQLKFKMTRNNTSMVFPNIEFEMLEISPTTGSISNCCHATYKDVEFSGVNHGNRYLLGIEVIENIKTALKITESFPIIFDRRGDIDNTNFSKIKDLTKSQIICTYITNDKNITIKGE